MRSFIDQNNVSVKLRSLIIFGKYDFRILCDV
jgi:hypothetical protein